MTNLRLNSVNYDLKLAIITSSRHKVIEAPIRVGTSFDEFLLEMVKVTLVTRAISIDSYPDERRWF